MKRELDVRTIRRAFPALATLKDGRPPIYLDSACSSLPCQAVVDALNGYCTKYPACGERSSHYWGRKVDEEVERARHAIAELINARDSSQIIFTKNATESLNLVARGLHWEKGDVVVTGDREHNSNRTPWDDLAREAGIARRVIQRDGTYDPHASFDVDYFLKELAAVPNLKMVSLAMTSNLDGVSIAAEDLRRICDHAHSRELEDELRDSYVMVDAAQTAPHRPIDVQDLGVDFLALSIHKMCGPTGLGVCYMKDPDILERALITGGGTVTNAFDDGSPPIYLRAPHKFEAGLQHWAGILGAGAAVSYLKDKLEWIPSHEQELNAILTDGLRPYHDQGVLTILGPLDPAERGSICTFEVTPLDEDEDVGRFFLEEVMPAADRHNLMFRAGDFCVSPYCRQIRGERVARIRLSLYLYNTPDECRTALEVLRPILDKRVRS